METALKCTQAITTCDASFHRTVVNISRLGILAVNNNCDIDRPGGERIKGSFGTRAGAAGRAGEQAGGWLAGWRQVLAMC